MHESLEKAKRVLELNKYPPTFYDRIIRESLESIIRSDAVKKTEKPEEAEEQLSSKSKRTSLKIQYRGKVTEDYTRALHKTGAPCNIVMTLRKLKTVMPSLKSPTEKMIKSGVVYKLICQQVFNQMFCGSKNKKEVATTLKQNKSNTPFINVPEEQMLPNLKKGFV